MAHTCEACGETFDTLTGLRLHDCEASPVEPSDEQGGRSPVDEATATQNRRQESRNRGRRQRARRITGDELDVMLERARDGDPDSALTALAHLEQGLHAAMERDDDGDAYRDVYWGYYEPTATALDAVAREEGWPFLLDLAAAYDPREEWELPAVGDPVTNIIARGVVRTRLTDGVAAVPPEALAYLAAVPEVGEGYDEIGWEESMHYGWGVGHPDHDVRETVLDLVGIDPLWASAAATRALYADQHAAVELYVDVVEAMPWEDRDLALDDLANIQADDYDRWFPEYWDVETEFDREFEFTFDEAVEARLRNAVEELGLVDGLSDDWTFDDLEVQWGPEDMSW